jgi:hypothetical protein
MSETRAMIPAVAQRDFRDAYAGLDLTPDQLRILAWAENWDQPTLNAMADVIRAARAEGQP